MRPAAGLLRSYPSKPELLAELAAIKQRQDGRADWIPRVYVDGQPLAAPVVVEDKLLLQTPAEWQERPELTLTDGGMGQLEVVLYTVLGVAGRHAGAEIPLNAAANEALVPAEMRWWQAADAPDPKPLEPADDPGMASETLATMRALGGVAIIEAKTESLTAVVDAVSGAPFWRHSGHWILDTWDPGEDAGMFATARASIGAWEAGETTGIVVSVGGAGLHQNDGEMSTPATLHTYLLSVTAAADGTDGIAAIHRLVLSCPGPSWCRRGGCSISSHNYDAATMAVAVIAEPADTATAAQHYGGWPAQAYDGLYGAGHGDDYSISVIDVCEMAAAGAPPALRVAAAFTELAQEI